MPTKQELEKFDIIYLAARCQQVADRPSAGKAIAEKAWQLKREWVMLVVRETPPPDYETHQQIQAQKEELKKRMAEFLATNL